MQIKKHSCALNRSLLPLSSHAVFGNGANRDLAESFMFRLRHSVTGRTWTHLTWKCKHLASGPIVMIMTHVVLYVLLFLGIVLMILTCSDADSGDVLIGGIL